MKTKAIPTILMLMAGAITSIICYLLNYEIKTMMFVLLGVMFFFFYLGDLIRYVLEKNVFIQEDEPAEEEIGAGEEGAVIEKEPSADTKGSQSART